MLVLGTTITKTIEGDSKSYSFRYIDWETPSNNVFHVTAEFAVERSGSSQTKRCDIVCFVNGIPFAVIENKRPTESLKKAGSQLIGYQSEDNIPHLFHFAQLLMTMNRAEARYATVGRRRSSGRRGATTRTGTRPSIRCQSAPDATEEERFSRETLPLPSVLRRACCRRAARRYRAGSVYSCVVPAGTPA